jgi:hypothetical protein
VRITDNLSYRKIFIFWGPLALTWLMMAAEQPFLVAVIARLSDAKYNLAAFGIAFSFALIIEAPVIMLMSASTALVTDRHSYRKLKRFTDILNMSVVAVQLILLIPPVFNFLVQDLMGVPDNVSRLTYISLILLIPWSPAIGYRRFYQGILIRNNLTGRVTYGTVIRLSVIGLAGYGLYLTGIEGAYVGAATLSIAVFLEAIASWSMARNTVRRIINDGDFSVDDPRSNSHGEKVGYRFIARFYTPLALTSLLSLGVNPFVVFFLGRSHMAIESLAVLPVVNSLVFIFRSMGLSYQEVLIALVGDRKQNYPSLRNFAITLGVIVTVIPAIIAFTPLANLWFLKVSGLTPELAAIAFTPLKLMLFLPALSVLLSFQRSTLVITGKTRPISIATGIELMVIIGVLLVCVIPLGMVGATAAAIAYTVGKSASNLYLAPKQLSTVRGWRKSFKSSL